MTGLGRPSREYVWRNREEQRRAMEQMLRVIRTLHPRDREAWILDLSERLEVSPEPPEANLMMTWEQVREMKAQGQAFGSHTATHPILSRLSAEEMECEIAESCQAVQEQIGLSAVPFAYPNGTKDDFTQETVDLLKHYGHVCAVTTVGGNNDAVTDLFRLRRQTPWDQDIARFSLRLHAFRCVEA